MTALLRSTSSRGETPSRSGRDHDRRAVLVGAADHQHVVARAAGGSGRRCRTGRRSPPHGRCGAGRSHTARPPRRGSSGAWTSAVIIRAGLRRLRRARATASAAPPATVTPATVRSSATRRRSAPMPSRSTGAPTTVAASSPGTSRESAAVTGRPAGACAPRGARAAFTGYGLVARPRATSGRATLSPQPAPQAAVSRLRRPAGRRGGSSRREATASVARVPLRRVQIDGVRAAVAERPPLR